MRFVPGNAQHIGARHSQQDSFGFGDPEDQQFIAHAGFLAIVCDGMGGMECGDAASKTAVRAFLDAYQRKLPQESIPAALERCVIEANQAVVALAHSLGMPEAIGTTLIAVSIHQRELYFTSVGDSGIFYVSHGDLRMINRPHVFANILDAAVARGTLSREDAMSHPERESLTSYIGAERLEEIDRNQDPVVMRPGDAVLLASDGLFKTLDENEIRACLTGNPESWPESLVQCTLAKKRDYQDNVTVLSISAQGDVPIIDIPRTMNHAPPAAVLMVPAAPLVEPAVAPWTPPLQATTTAPPGSSVPWLFIAALLLIGVAIGLWYWEHRPDRPEKPLVSPSTRPVDLTPDPNAPAAPNKKATP
jgi:serine/threonine protein phosphatase PrpC